jgi:spore coat protein U-like protein
MQKLNLRIIKKKKIKNNWIYFLSACALFADITKVKSDTLPTSFLANATVNASCSVSTSTMTFATYTETRITASSNVVLNCSNGRSYTVSLANSPDYTDNLRYKLILDPGGDASVSSNYLLVGFFKNADNGLAMTSGAASFTGTGTGSATTIGQIWGYIAASQTGKMSGTFNKVMTLNISYQ